MNRKTIDFYDQKRYCNFLDMLGILECLSLLDEYSNVLDLYILCTNHRCYKAAIGCASFTCSDCSKGV